MADSLFTELKRRNVFKVGVAYLVMAWVVIQITTEAVPALHLPDWINTAVFFFGIIGFPFAIFFAWAFELTPEGLKREHEVNRDESITHHTSRKLDFVIIGLLVVALGYFIYESRFENETELQNVNSAESSDTGGITENTPTGSSIAVLPFVNMSSNPEQEYFSDGISEEILNVLTQIPNLHVTSRSSSFSFKGKENITSEVAAKLGVKNILEGSVRTSGKFIRITAQLITADSDKHLWSETYDRELTVDNIFAIQDEISNAIVSALKVHLLKGIVSSPNKTNNMETYNEYLIGLAMQNRLTEEDLIAAREKFIEVIALEPGFAPAYAQAAYTWLLLTEYSSQKISNEELDSKIVPLLNKALELNPQLAEAVAIQGRHHFLRERFEQAKSKLDRAIQLNPNYALAYLWRSRLHRAQFQYLDMLSDTERAYELNPMDLNISSGLAADYRSFGRPHDAEKIVKRMQELHPNHMTALFAQVYNQLFQGNYAKGLLIIQKAQKNDPDNETWKDFSGLGYMAIEMVDEALASENNHYTADLLSSLGKSDRAEMVLSKMVEDEPDSTHVIEHEIKHYLTNNNLEKLGSTIDKWTELSEKNGQTWRDKCVFEVLLAKQKTGKTDGLDSMLASCRRQTIGALEADYLCPCSWGELVQLAILEGRHNDAIKRANEWLDYGGSQAFLETNVFFSMLEDHPQYPTIIKRNKEQIARQRRIYNELVSSVE